MNAAVNTTVPIRPYRNSGFLPIRSAIGFALCAACLVFYRIDKETELEMSAELTERRATFVTPLPTAP
jgi:hypothetical protein